MSIIETGFKAANIIIGVETHKSTHVAVAINEHGARLPNSESAALRLS